MFRMSLEDFEIVLGHIQDQITPKEIIGGTRPILADERLALTLQYLPTGESFRSLSFQFHISKAAVSYILASCCDAIVERMVSIFISLPSSTDEWLKMAEHGRWDLPHELGAIDGKHVTIRKPINQRYCNYKKTNSVILMAQITNVSGQMLVPMAEVMTGEYGTNPDCKKVLKMAQLNFWREIHYLEMMILCPTFSLEMMRSS